jgi:PAS domain S-box-containing protein
MKKSRPLVAELLRQLMLVAGIPILVTTGIFFWQIYPQLIHNISQEQQSIATLAAEQTQQRIRTAEQQVLFLLELTQDREKIGNHTQDISSLLNGFVKKNSFFDTLYLLDKKGRIQQIAIRDTLQDTANKLYLGVDTSRSTLFKAQGHIQHKRWSQVVLSVVTGRLSIALMVPYGNGILVAELAIDRLPQLSQELSTQGLFLLILDKHAQLIAHPDPKKSQQQINMSTLSLLNDDGQGRLSSGTFDMDGVRYFGTRVKMTRPNWNIIVAEEQEAIYAPLYRTIKLWLLSIVIIIIIVIFFARRRANEFSTRFEILNKQAREITQGRYQPSFEEPSITEFKELSDNLLVMADAINKREQSLQTQEQQLRNTLESAPNIAIQWYDETGKVHYWNRASEHIFGISEKQALNAPLEQLMFKGQSAEEFRKSLRRVTQKHVSSEDFELPFQHNSGRTGFVQGSVFSVPTQSGKDLCVCMMTDVTQQRQAEANIIKLNQDLELRVEDRTRVLRRTNSELSDTIGTLNETMEQLVHSEKLAALGSLVAGIAHELNTPIGNALLASSSLNDFTTRVKADLEKGTIKKSTLENFLNDAASASAITYRNLERASELISSFKQVASDQSSSQRRQFKLRELVNEILLTLQPQTKKRPITIETSIDPSINMDSFPGPLGQVLGNLVINAEIHGFDEGAKGNIWITATAHDNTVAITVRDNGLGIDEAYIGKLFDPFYTTRLGLGGSGLGLHIVHNITTEVLGGTVDVNSKLGEGSEFTVTIPLLAP